MLKFNLFFLWKYMYHGIYTYIDIFGVYWKVLAINWPSNINHILSLNNIFGNKWRKRTTIKYPMQFTVNNLFILCTTVVVTNTTISSSSSSSKRRWPLYGKNAKFIRSHMRCRKYHEMNINMNVVDIYGWFLFYIFDCIVA